METDAQKMVAERVEQMAKERAALDEFTAMLEKHEKAGLLKGGAVFLLGKVGEHRTLSGPAGYIIYLLEKQKHELLSSLAQERG